MIIRDMARGGMAERPGSGMPCVPAVFVSPHQDDELLFMGAAIMEHVAQGRGRPAAVRLTHVGFRSVNEHAELSEGRMDPL